MRKSLVALLLLLGVSAFSANLVLAAMAESDRSGDDLGMKLMNAQMVKELSSRSTRLGTSTGNTDTTFVGYTPGPVITASGGVAYSRANNYWSIYAINGKQGGKRPVNGQPDKATWDFEDARSTNDANYAYWGTSGDSLQGWVPVRNLMSGTGGLTLPDYNRPWWCVDMGNQANYVGNLKNGRTFGVNGVWHVDGGDAVGVGTLPRPQWHAPVGSSAVWMGLRAHGDNSYTDSKNGNAFNEDVLMYNQITAASASGNDKAFPGYGSQMDQMLYKDVDYTGHSGENLSISFKFKTVMSKSFGTTASTRSGWFDADPLQVTPGGGAQSAASLNNFISSTTAGTSAPCDSFMVYVGSGIDAGDNVLYSDGSVGTVYDVKHRWFDEVLHWDRDGASDPLHPQPLHYKELMSVAGNYPFDVSNAAFADTGFVIPGTALAPYLNASNKIRLVFRVKTNRGFDDEGTAYTSGGKGAAVVDNVVIQQGANAAVTSGFENASEIDNTPATPATAAWKTTGKPPGVFDHVHAFADLLYEDLCGQKGDISRICNMTGVVVSAGDHDHSEAASGLVDGTADRERWNGMFSPTIQLAGPYNVTSDGRNAQGLYGIGGNGGVGDINPDNDFYIQYDIYAGIMNPFTKGNLWRFGCQSYPSNTNLAVLGGTRLGPTYPAWGQVRFPGFIIFNPDPQCFPDFEGFYQNSLIKTSNSTGIPDSLRLFLGKRQECYRFGVSTGCSPVDGCYWDNICLAIIDGLPAQLSVDIWQWYQDTFPFNQTPGFAGNAALFDTTSALIKTGLNTSQTTNTATRPDVPGDSVNVLSSPTSSRVDMVFRILPGPGNYEPIGQGHTGYLRKVPTSPALVTKGDGSFWDVYRQNPGDFASPNASVLLHNGKAGWDPNVWLSARLDTAEVNLFALQGRNVLGGPGDPTVWMSTYHESDSHLAALGISKPVCFVNDPAGVLTSPNIICNGTVPTWAQPFVPGGAAGGFTTEFTKIIPDGLLTPGAHVEYFFRDQKGNTAPQPVADGLCPDTSVVFPQNAEGSTDGHRWQEFAVLPDRWKDSHYQHPVTQQFGLGPACMLVVDANDRRGNEHTWVGIADTIGLTPAGRRGAHNGWATTVNLDMNDPANFVYAHLGQAGGPWDLYQFKASESLNTGSGSIGSRLSTIKTGSPLANESCQQGPTPEMLAQYQMILYLTGDLNSGILGPFSNRSQNDCGILTGWLNSGNTSTPNRGFWALGDGFIEDGDGGYAPTAPQTVFMNTTLRTTAKSYNFSQFSGFHGNVALLRLQPGWQGKGTDKSQIQVYGIRNQCLWTNDVADQASPLLTAFDAYYDAPLGGQGTNSPAGVYKSWASTSPWQNLVDGWDIEHLTNPNDNHTTMRNEYFLKIFNNVWSLICSRLQGTAVTGLDEPTFDDGSVVNYVNLRNNPLAAGSAHIDLSLARADRVQLKVFDVSGRLVRTLADRQFPAGLTPITWDGVDNSGKLVNRGAYFVQVKYASAKFAATKKLIVLK